MASIMTPRLAKYNVRWGNKSNHSSINVSDIMASYKKRVRAVLGKNKHLARALETSRKKASDLENDINRQQKVYNLALPQIKTWLEMGMQHARSMYEYQSRAVSLLQEIMSPGVDFTLARVSDDDDYGDINILDRRPSLRPPEKSWVDRYADFTVIPEDDEDVNASIQTLHDMNTLEPETMLRDAGITPRAPSDSRPTGLVSIPDGLPCPPAKTSLPTIDKAALKKSRGSRTNSGRITFLDAASSPPRKPQASTLEDSLQWIRGSKGSKDRRPRWTDNGTDVLDCAFFEPSDLTAPLRKNVISIEEVATGGAQNCIPEVDDTPRQKIPSTKPPTLTTSAEHKKASRVSFALDKENETDEQDRACAEPTQDPIAGAAETSPSVVQRSPEKASRRASRTLRRRSSLESQEGCWDKANDKRRSSDSTLSLWAPGQGQGTRFSDIFKAIGNNLGRGRRTWLNPPVFELSTLESPILAAATVPEVVDLASAEKATSPNAKDNNSEVVTTSRLQLPENLPTLDNEKTCHVGVVRTKENKLVSAAGLYGVGPAAAPITSTESPTGVSQANSSQPTKRQAAKTTRHRRTRLEIVEDGTTSSLSPPSKNGEGVMRSASGRPVRSSAVGKNYKEPSTIKKLRRP